MTDTPDWLARVRALDIRAEELRAEQTRVADQRARIIADAVDAYGRGGRETARQHLGCSVGQIDQALRRARDTGTPDDDDLTVMQDAIRVLLRPGATGASSSQIAQALGTRRLDVVARRVQFGAARARTSNLDPADVDLITKAAAIADRILTEGTRDRV